MKHVGTKFLYSEDRDKDLMRAYYRELGNCKHISLPVLLDKVVNSPSKRYWVSEERAAIVLSAMFKGDRLENMGEMKREMFFDLFEEAKRIQEEHPDMSIADLAFYASRKPARKFYMKATSAKVIICKIKNKWKGTRQRLNR